MRWPTIGGSGVRGGYSGANGENINVINIAHKCTNTKASLHARSQRSRVKLGLSWMYLSQEITSNAFMS